MLAGGPLAVTCQWCGGSGAVMSTIDRSKWDYVLGTPHEDETAQQVCERLAPHRAFTKGCCYYQLLKKENISAAKQLALKRPSGGSWVMGGTEVRAELGLPAGAIKLAPGDLPGVAELYVQSTSSNRKLSADGGVLLLWPAQAALGDGEGGGASVPPPAAKRARTTPELAGIVKWSQLEGPLSEINDEEIAEETLVKKAPDDQLHEMDCDEPVPREMLNDEVEWLALVMRAGSADWDETEATTEPAPSRHWGTPPPSRRYQWVSRTAGARLMYLEIGEDLTVMVVEVNPHSAESPEVKTLLKCPLGLATGEAGAHPFIHAQRYQYANSDGSCSSRNIGKLLSPTVVMAKFIHDTAMHGENEEH